MIKLVLSDIDNTLVPIGDRRVSPRTMEAIHAVREAGVRFGPDTGRDYYELLRFFHMDEGCIETAIMSNAKRIRVDGRYVSVTCLPIEPLRRLSDLLRNERGMFLVCYPKDSSPMTPAYVVGTTPEELAPIERLVSFNGGIVNELPDIGYISGAIYCAGGKERMRRCERLVAENIPELDIVSPLEGFFDVLPHGFNKASGLDIVLDATGIKPEEVVVFGDSGNDLTIMRKAVHPVAVANAIPEVKAISEAVVGASRDEGVADALFEIARASASNEMPSFLQ